MPAGLTLANYLGQMGVRTLVVERNAATVQEPRAVSIDDESLRTMQALGLVERVLPTIVSGYGARYDTPNHRRFARIAPTAAMVMRCPKTCSSARCVAPSAQALIAAGQCHLVTDAPVITQPVFAGVTLRNRHRAAYRRMVRILDGHFGSSPPMTAGRSLRMTRSGAH